jgi:glycosyltransferase involved in cell wall biosynthesis
MPADSRDRKTLLIVSQTFVPDPASVGQHMADAAIELANRGRRVRVLASARGYENPNAVYPRRQRLGRADVRRFHFASFGKRSIALRVAGTAAFMVQAFFSALRQPRLGGIFFSTSPPLIGLPMCIVAALRRVPAIFWAMDLNPDQLIALGKLQPSDWTTRLLEAVNRFILRRASLIVALDRFMADRLAQRGVPRRKMLVMPPWPHEQHIQADPGPNPFRLHHDLQGKFVIMYSGNHSPSNPLTTLLDAAVQLKGDVALKFLFVGGGTAKAQVQAYIRDHNLDNVMSLPYQPLEELKNSLTAADVHAVSLGQPMVGIVHPCKIYGAMAAARPILFLGPRPSHISDILQTHGIGLQVSHGDVAGMIAAIERFRAMPAAQLADMGNRARQTLRQFFSQDELRRRFCDAVENAIPSHHKAPGSSEIS